MKFNFAALGRVFNNLNTHTVGGIGVGTGLVSLAALVAQRSLDQFLPSHGLGAVSPFVDFYAQNLAAPLLATGLGAAYYGRPHTVPDLPLPLPEVAPPPVNNDLASQPNSSTK